MWDLETLHLLYLRGLKSAESRTILYTRNLTGARALEMTRPSSMHQGRPLSSLKHFRLPTLIYMKNTKIVDFKIVIIQIIEDYYCTFGKSCV